MKSSSEIIDESKYIIRDLKIMESSNLCDTCMMNDLCKFKDIFNNVRKKTKDNIPKLSNIDDTNFINKNLRLNISCRRWRSDEVSRGSEDKTM